MEKDKKVKDWTRKHWVFWIFLIIRGSVPIEYRNNKGIFIDFKI